MRLLAAIALALLLLLLAMAYSWLPGSRESGVLPIEPPASYFRYPAQGEFRGRVFVVHGLNSSKNTMGLLSRRLSEAGFEVTAMDLPGHGDSQSSFDALKARAAIEGVLDSIGEFDGVVGHSLGGGLLADLANERKFRRMVLLSPAPTPIQQVDAERVLLFVGQFDSGHIRDFAFELERAVTGHVELRDLAWTGHSGALFRPGILDEIALWLSGEAQASSIRLRLALWFGLFVTCLGLGAVAIGGATPQVPGLQPAAPRTVVVIYVAAGFGAASIVALLDLTQWLHLFATDYLMGVLFLLGIAAVGIGRLRVVLNRSALGIALCAAIYVIVVLFWWLGSEVLHLSATGPRAWRFAALAILGLPLSVFDEAAIRPVRPWLKSVGLAVLTRALLAAAVSTAALTIQRPDAFVLMLMPLLMLFWIGLWLLGALVSRRTRDPLSTAVFMSLVQAWVFAATFVIDG